MEGGALRESAQIPQEFITQPSAPLSCQIRSQRTSLPPLLYPFSLSFSLSLSISLEGKKKKKKKKKSGFSQPWESFSCQREKLNELVVERNMPCLFKPRLNPGCLIVSNIPQLPPTLERVSSVNCPVREPGCLATQAKGGQSQLLVTLDPKLNTEKSMSSGYGAHKCWPTTQKSHTESMQAKSSLEKHIA